MDDLDYSVMIAERDWVSFYEESEECSIQQAWLASLDDSGFSDTDDEKKSTKGPDLDLQIRHDKPKEESKAVTQTKSEEDDYKAGTLSEEPESLSCKTGNDRSATHTAGINLNNVSTPDACLTLDSSVIVTIFTNQQHADLNVKDFTEHNENHIEDKSCQVVGKPNTLFSCIQEDSHVEGSEEKTILMVSESSATPKKEKERWFVTVNDSPVKQKVKSEQKKGRKKKTSRKLVRHRLVAERQCSVSNNNNNNNNNKEEEEEKEVIKDEQILQNEFKQASQTYSEHSHFNPCPNHVCEAFLSGSCNDKEVVLSPTEVHEKATSEKTSVPEINCTLEASSFNAKEENISCLCSFKCKANSDVPTETFKINPPASVNSLSPTILTDSPQLQTDAVVNDQSMCVNTPDHLMSINSNHKAFEDDQSDGSRFILEAIITSSENLQNQKYPTQMPKELQLSSQETQNHETQIGTLEAGVGPIGPVYALSSFWDEMEKLTINDILHLRSFHNRSPTSRSVIYDESDVHIESTELLTSNHDSVQENGSMDDSADSDYFTHVDESKPERSSCKLSVFSHCDEEFLQIPNRNENSCSEHQYIKEQTASSMSAYSPGHEFDLNIDTESLDIIRLSHQDGIQHYLYPAILSFGKTTENQSMLTFSDILATDINGAISSDRLSNTAVSCPFTQNLSVCEMYYDFFSDFEIGDFLSLSPQDKTVPIFNASRSVARCMVVSHMEELDFNPDFEQVNIPIRDLTHISSQPEMCTSPLGMTNLCSFMSHRGNWNSIFSLRRVSFIGKGSTWNHEVSSGIFPKEAKKETACVFRAQQLAPLMEVGQKSFLQLAEPQPHAVFMPKKDNFIFSIKQADMCLVCIAIASWVLKSSRSQSTDTWKAALLANISAISAIQYLRKYETGHR